MDRDVTVQHLADLLGATLIGDGAAVVRSCAPIERAGPADVTFLSNTRYIPFLETTRAAAVLMNSKAQCPPHITRLVVDDPYLAFRNAMIHLHGFRKHPAVGEIKPTPGGARISSLAVVHPQASVGRDTSVHPFVVIEQGAMIGARCCLYPGTYVGVDVRIGDDCVLYPNVVVYERCIIGDRVHLHSGTVIGQDGFGYATSRGEHHKIPQTGIVVIEDDVELGAGCAIERAAMGETRIGAGTKFADLISIGHGTSFGKHCLVVSLAGVAGSVTIGDHVVLGGQVGVSGHISIGDRVQAMARTAIAQDVPADLKVGGVPAVPYDLAKRNALAGLELYDLFKRVKSLEKELERLKKPVT